MSFFNHLLGSNYLPFTGFARFDGVNDFITIPNASQNNSLTSISIFFRIRTLETRNTVVLEKSNNNSNYFIQTSSTTVSGPTPGRLFFGTTVSSTGGATPALNNDAWHTYMVTFSGGSLKTYLDGVIVFDSTIANTPPTNTQNWLLGSRSGGAAFKGDIAHLICYNRVVPLQEFNRLEQGFYLEDGLVWCYPLQGNAQDISKYKNNGTSSGTLFLNL